MLRRFFAAHLRRLVYAFCISAVAPTAVVSQNLLINGDFEAVTAPNYGDNVGVTLTGWMRAHENPNPTSQSTTNYRELSVVKVDGPGGQPVTLYNSPFGQITPWNLPESDVTFAGAAQDGHYIRLNTKHFWSVVGQRITAPYTGCIAFGGVTAGTSASGDLFRFGSINPFYGGLSTNPDPTYAMDNISTIGNTGGQFVAEQWTLLKKYYAVEATEQYAWAYIARPGYILDDAFAHYVDNSYCPTIPAGTPNPPPVPSVPDLDPQDVDLTKSCVPTTSSIHNGQIGQMWECTVDVTVPIAPFGGSLTVTDLYTPTSTTASEVVSSGSATGSFDCSLGASCTIIGANFDTSGTETLSYSIFVTATDLQDTYPMQNCVEGAYDDGAGNVTPIAGNCVSAQWIPRSSVVKTCSPIAPVTSGPMTLNCQIEVTGTDLTTDSILMVGDGFGALPPMTATISGAMMNVTSNEPWNCVDANLNAPGSTGLCELSATDMFAAGGSSTLNVSFQFTTDQSSGQVANCPMTDILPTSYIDAIGLRSSQPPMRSPQASSAAGLPDNCVILDLPKVVEQPKIKSVEVQKTCNAPAPATHQGAQGYTWDCRAEIIVTPTPFSGTFTFDDDASNISIGTAQFVSASEPNCTGLTTDHLQCQLDGSTMTAPHVVSYQLFTEVIDPDQPIEWTNCATGAAQTAAGTFPSDAHCVDTVIKPEVSTDPQLKEISIKKSCGRSFEEERDGVRGLGWDCEITVNASPVPFSGVFTFTEDASAVTGSSNAAIVDILQQGNAWSCTPNVPTSVTDCSIAGNDFDPSGSETIGFHLFAETGDEPIAWRNCVDGVYTPATGTPHEVKGNCESTTWKPDSDPQFSLKKGCRLAGVDGGNALYACSIYITQTGGTPISSALTFDELFSTSSGASAAQYIVNLQGTPTLPNGWDCGQAPYTTGASCTISAADFNGNTGHRIDAFLSIPTAVLGKDDFKNCAQVRIGDQVVGSADCVIIDEPDPSTTFDVEKSCKATGERIVMGPNTWFQAYQCTLIVTTNGVPFTGPLWVTEDLHFGQNPGAASIQNITSADPWDCASPPYGPVGQGNTPYCGIQGNQFPASGTSSLTVDLMMNSTMDTFGAENCVEISVGAPTAAGLPAPVASDCFEIAPTPNPKDPSIDLVKTCSPAQQSTPGQWTVACTLTITGQNLPAGQQVRVTDELMSSATQTAFYGQVMGPTNACGGGQMNGGTSSACDITTDDINAAPGGVLTIPFTGSYQGPAGRPLGGAQAQNCAFVDVAALGLHGPVGGNGKSCVPVTFPIASVGGAGPLTGTVTPPLTPTPGTGVIEVDPIIDTGVPPVATSGCGFDTLFLIDRSGSMNLHNRLPLTKQALIAALRIFEGGGSKSGAIVFNQSANVIGGPSTVLPSPSLEAAIGGITAWGNEDWQVGMSATNSVVSGIADKPLVLFISDGVPGKPFAGNAVQNINAAVPALNALRNQGSRVVGIALGYTSVATGLSTLLGPNQVTAGGNVAFDPQVTDVVHISESSQIIPAFEAIARAYCPERKGMTQPQKEALMAEIQAMPKAASVYMGDDEDHAPFGQETVVQPTIQPSVLTIHKEQTGPCEPNRASQSYDCGFRLSVTNTGGAPYSGPLTITDTVGKPGVKSAALLSQGGWACARPVRDSISCSHPLLTLAAGASTHLDLRMGVKGLRKGGTVENCAAVGIPADRTQRVAAIQQIMNARGLNAGPVDGKPGKKTFAALAQLQASLGLPRSTDFDDRLFAALGLPLQIAGTQSCVSAPLPPMPAPPLQCNLSTTVKSDGKCACRFDHMERRSATSCQCGRGFRLVKGKGCVAEAVPTPKPVPDAAGLACEKASTRLRGNQCVCRDQKNAKKVSPTQCRCRNGLPMVGGKCLTIKIAPRPKPSVPGTDAASPSEHSGDAAKCRLRINGICLK